MFAYNIKQKQLFISYVKKIPDYLSRGLSLHEHPTEDVHHRADGAHRFHGVSLKTALFGVGGVSERVSHNARRHADGNALAE